MSDKIGILFSRQKVNLSRYQVLGILSLGILLFLISCHQSYRTRIRSGDLQDLGLIIPVEGVQNLENISPFGSPRQHGRRLHNGIDIFAPAGTAVIAPQNGRVVYVSFEESAGNYIYLLDYRGEYLYEFLHLQSPAPGIEKGVEVRQGEVIGFVGNTGNARGSPPHLHFSIAHLLDSESIFRNKRYLDPKLFIK
ncbi:MAG: hypothetical protein Kow0042_27050 [Calditrichia bacterium]